MEEQPDGHNVTMVTLYFIFLLGLNPNFILLDFTLGMFDLITAYVLLQLSPFSLYCECIHISFT